MRKRMEVGSAGWSITIDLRDVHEPHERPAAQRRFNAHRYMPYGLLTNRERPKRLQNTSAARRERRTSPRAACSSTGGSASSASGASGESAGGGDDCGHGDDPPPPPSPPLLPLVDQISQLAADANFAQ